MAFIIAEIATITIKISITIGTCLDSKPYIILHYAVDSADATTEI